jgi:hypothetical protein
MQYILTVCIVLLICCLLSVIVYCLLSLSVVYCLGDPPLSHCLLLSIVCSPVFYCLLYHNGNTYLIS